MIKFFRKIRYNLMEHNKTGKYLKYAVGEIVLVVIGILIALSINNWNQQRLDDKEEQRVLSSIIQDIELSRFLYTQGKWLSNRTLNSTTALLEMVEGRKKGLDEDSLNYHIDRLTRRWFSSTPTSFYDALINSGEFKLIASYELRDELTSLKSNQEFLGIYEGIGQHFVDEQFSPYINQYINRSQTNRKSTTNGSIRNRVPEVTHKSNYAKMLNERKFTNLMVEYNEHIFNIISNYLRLEKNIAKIDSLASASIKN